MDFKTRQRLKAKSLLAFGKTSRWKTIMNRGRPVTNKAGVVIETAPISVKEIEDTMDYILKEREEKQKAILEEMDELRKENDERGNKSTQRDSSTKTATKSNGNGTKSS